MRLTVHTDYSLRLLMYLATNGDKLATIGEIADTYGISKNHLMKVAYELGRHGILETVRGRKGGLRLARWPEKICLGEIVRLTEDNFTMVECFDETTNACIIAGPCRLRGVLSNALKAYLAVLDGYTLADLTARSSELSRAFFAA